MQDAQITIGDGFAREQLGVPFRFCAFKRGGPAKDRERAESGKRTAANLYYPPAFKAKVSPGYMPAHDRFLAQQQLGKTNSTTMLGRSEELDSGPIGTAAQHREPSPQESQALERGERQEICQARHASPIEAARRQAGGDPSCGRRRRPIIDEEPLNGRAERTASVGRETGNR